MQKLCILLLLSLCITLAKAQTEAEKELQQAFADYKAEKYAEALPIFEKYKKKALNDTFRYTMQDAQAKLKKGEALVEIIRIRTYEKEPGRDTLYVALVLKPDSPKPEMVVLENGNELEKRYLNNYRNSIKKKLEDKLSYSNYWKEIAGKLQGVKKVYFSPDGVYHQINLLTLQNPETKRYLIDEIDIRLLDSFHNLVTLKDETEAPDFKDYQICLFGKPLFEDGTLVALPGTKIEVGNIQALSQAQGIQTKVFLGSDATEANLKSLKRPNILHIATHGFFLNDTLFKDGTNILGMESLQLKKNPDLRSGLLFTGAEKTLQGKKNTEGEDGILTAQEAKMLDLSGTELAVLSAVESGLVVVDGGNIYGLQRSFRQAGAKSVLASLWSISDEATQKLMTLFYGNWLDKKQPKREAFKNAQVQLRAEFPHPYYWGAFVMVGE